MISNVQYKRLDQGPLQGATVKFEHDSPDWDELNSIAYKLDYFEKLLQALEVMEGIEDEKYRNAKRLANGTDKSANKLNTVFPWLNNRAFYFN